MQFCSSVTFGHASQDSAISADSQMNVHCYHVIEEYNAFMSPMLQIGGCKKNMHGSSVIESMCGIHFAQTFCFHQGAGEEMLITCWRDSYFCSICHA
jgi:hypothetical protein